MRSQKRPAGSRAAASALALAGLCLVLAGSQAAPAGAAAVSGPQAVPAQDAAEARENAIRARRGEFASDYNRIIGLQASDPQRYAQEQEAVLERKTALARDMGDRSDANGLYSEIATEYIHLCAFVRFRLLDPRNAARLYEKGVAAVSEGKIAPNLGVIPLQLALADVRRFDLKQPAAASAIYHAMLAEQKRRPSRDEDYVPLERLMTAWMIAEIAFLDRGVPFAGRPERELVDIMLVVILAQGYASFSDNPALASLAAAAQQRTLGAKPSAEVQRMLEDLAPSQVNLLGALNYLPALGSSDRILAFMRRHDPTGFLSVCAFLGFARMDGDRGKYDAIGAALWSPAELALVKNAGTKRLAASPR